LLHNHSKICYDLKLPITRYNGYMNRLFVGRHGRTDANRELGTDGKADAGTMAAWLKAAGFMRGIVLASTAHWVVETGRIIQEETDSALFRSPYIRCAGEHPGPIESLHRFVERFMGACAIEHTDSDVMVVTHAPLVGAVAGTSPEFARVYPIADNWVNPKFEPDFAFLLNSGKPW
jgi:phosphohistidine phosphatase SixA